MSSSAEAPTGHPLGGAAEGRLRWAVNNAEWKPKGEYNGSEFQFLLSLIREPLEREAIDKFVRFVDQKRAVLSRLLVRRACAAVLGFSNYKEIEIARTKGKKPFLRKPRPRDDRPDLCNFNFNVSHEGEWVVLASEPLCLCGVDVAAPHDRRPGGKEFDVFETFKEQLTDTEWRTVEREAVSAMAKRMTKDTGKNKQMPGRGAGHMLPAYMMDGQDPMSLFGNSEEENGNRPTTRPLNQPVGYQAFQRFWSAKEAFVKARGDGLGFELNRAEFTFATQDETIPTYSATVAIDGKQAPFWRCYQERLGENHWATVARGPTCDVVDAHGEFSRTLTRATSSIPWHDWEDELLKESPRFQVVPVGFLVPPDDMAGYVAAGGTQWPEDASIPAVLPAPAQTASRGSDGEGSGPEISQSSSMEAAAGVPVNDPEVLLKKALAEISRLELKGKEHLQEKEYQKALSCYSSAVDLAREHSEGTPKELYGLLCKRASCHMELQDFESALSDASAAVELDKSNAEAYFQKGRAFEGLGDYSKSLESVEQGRMRTRE